MLDRTSTPEQYRTIHSRLMNLPPPRRFARRSLRPLAEVEAASRADREAGFNSQFVVHGLTVEQIVAAVCGYFNMPRRDVLSHRRPQELMHPRLIIMYLAYEHTGKTLSQIGRHLNGRDHTTIMYGKAKVARLLRDGSPKLACDIARIRSLLGVD